MIKPWWVVCEVDHPTDKEVKMIVKAKSHKESKSKAINELYSRGYNNVRVISVDLVAEGGYSI